MASESPLVVVVGTGTDVGKTHVATAVLRAWGVHAKTIGYKPVETGVGPSGVGEDARSLAEASTFHVKHPPLVYRFAPPVSPHLAARSEGVVLDLAKLAEQAAELRAQADGVVVELAGGLFTPVSREKVNADLARALRPSAVLLVAPDRIGVLHDVGATLRAARACGLPVTAIALSAPLSPDASTGTNATEIEDIMGVSVLARFPRADPYATETEAAARAVLAGLKLAVSGRHGRKPTATQTASGRHRRKPTAT